MSEWKKAKIGDFISVKHGYAFPGEGIIAEDNGVVLVTPGNFRVGGGFKDSGKKFFKGEYPADYVLKAGDFIVTMTDLSKESDTLGYSAIVPASSDYIYLHNQRIGLVEFHSTGIDRGFLYWLMRTKTYQHEIVAGASGTTVKHTSPSRIADVEISLPPLPTQKKIAAVLGALDDKIENNRKICKTLEEQAQAIFKSWFVDFDPFGGKRPDGWKEVPLAEIVESMLNGDWGKDTPDGKNDNPVYCVRGADIPDVIRGNKGKMPLRYILPKNFATRQLSNGDVVVEISGGSPTQSTGRAAFITDSLLKRYDRGMVCTNFCKAVKPKSGYGHLFYFWWRYLYEQGVFFRFENGTTGIKNLDIKTVLSEQRIVMPTAEYLAKFASIANGVLDVISEKGLESETLAELRDALLPKLMSGEIDVEKVVV